MDAEQDDAILRLGGLALGQVLEDLGVVGAESDLQRIGLSGPKSNATPLNKEEIYRGTTDGFTAQKFHAKCDSDTNKPTPTLVIVSVGNSRFGGYTDESWAGAMPGSSQNTFIFTLANGYGIVPTQFKFINYGKVCWCRHRCWVWRESAANDMGCRKFNFMAGGVQRSRWSCGRWAPNILHTPRPALA